MELRFFVGFFAWPIMAIMPARSSVWKGIVIKRYLREVLNSKDEGRWYSWASLLKGTSMYTFDPLPSTTIRLANPRSAWILRHQSGNKNLGFTMQLCASRVSNQIRQSCLRGSWTRTFERCDSIEKWKIILDFEQFNNTLDQATRGAACSRGTTVI